MTEPARRRGRPPKPAVERKRANITLRVRDHLRERLAEQAAAHQRSISEEAEARLERSFDRQDLLVESLTMAFGGNAAALLLLLGRAASDTGRIVGWMANDGADAGTWLSSPQAFHEVEEAVQLVLSALRPPGELRFDPRGFKVGKEIAAPALLEVTGDRKAEARTELVEAIRRMLGDAVVDRLKGRSAEIATNLARSIRTE